MRGKKYLALYGSWRTSVPLCETLVDPFQKFQFDWNKVHHISVSSELQLLLENYPEMFHPVLGVITFYIHDPYLLQEKVEKK